MSPSDRPASPAGEPNEFTRRANLARLDALHRTGLLDSPPEASFDRLTALACRLLQVPVALISLLDETRQVLKSACGLSEPWDTCREVPLAHVFCRHVVDSDAPVQIDDAYRHPLVGKPLARRDLGAVSYLGVPLRTPDGLVLGALCAIGHQPRHWTTQEVSALEDLAAVVAREIEVRRELKQRHEAIQAAEQLTQSLLDSSGDCIQMVDVDGRLLYLNPTGCSLMEVEDPAPLAGRYWPGLWTDEAVQAAEAAMARAKAGGSGRFQAFAPTLKGTPKWWDVVVTAVTDHAGRAVKLLAISRDVTSTKEAENQLRESETRFRNMANHMAQLAWTADASGWVFWYNQRWFDYTGTTLEAVQGWGWQKVHHPDHIDRVVEKIRHCFNSGEPWEDTFPLRGRDGSYRWFLSRAFPIHDDLGRVVQWFGTNTDITEQLEAEAAVQASEAQLRLVTDHASVFLLQCDREHRFKFVNRSYAARFGLEPQRIVGARIADIIGAEAYALIQPHIAAVLGGQRVEFEIELPFEQLGRRWMHVVYVPEWAPHGDVIGFVGIIADISLRKWAEEALRDSEERLKIALAGADMGVWTWDVNTGVVYWSPEVYRLFGTDAFDGTAEAFTRFVHPEDVAPVWNAVHEALANKTLYSTEFRIVQPDGAVRWMSTRGRADYTPDGRPMRMLGIVMDITDRKLAEQEVERARDEALAASRAKDDFLAALSHELRTPLNPVLLLASEAANNLDLPPEVRADFDTIAKNVTLEARLIDDLLDLTQITRGKLVLDRYAVDVHVVLQDAVATVQAELQLKQLGLSLALEAEAHTVLGDATRLQQVFWNVLKNAVKFTPTAGKIRIETRTHTTSGTLNVRVVDTGIGISPEELKRVFNAFSQGDHAMSGDLHRFGGVGLGLTISRLLVELHQGQIRASSAGRGHGATFEIDLPLLRPSLPERGPDPARPLASALPQASDAETTPCRGRILLIEDHAPTRRTLTRLLTRRRYEVSAAASVAEAHALASQKRFDLVVSDIGLPDGDGYTLMAELRLAQPDLIGIALSGYGMEEDLSRSRTAGFAAHLIKPISIGALARVLADIWPASGAVQPPSTKPIRP